MRFILEWMFSDFNWIYFINIFTSSDLLQNIMLAFCIPMNEMKIQNDVT